jgi:hypothetical protein
VTALSASLANRGCGRFRGSLGRSEHTARGKGVFVLRFPPPSKAGFANCVDFLLDAIASILLQFGGFVLGFGVGVGVGEVMLGLLANVV